MPPVGVRLLVPALVAGILLTDATALAAPTGAPVPASGSIAPAPVLPRAPDVPTTVGKAGLRSLPAAGSAVSGRWTVWAGTPGRPTPTLVAMPPADGVPLLADWNGDGVATPGRFVDGTWFITNAAVDSPEWVPMTAFGAAGDVPVTGRLDRDRRADIGVFRAGTWLWQRANGQPQPDVAFGAAGDVPVVGDWDGDGWGDLGVVRGGNTWILRLARLTEKPDYGRGVDVRWDRAAGVATVSFTFGRRTDLPVVGDWDGDGRDDPGMVRARYQWLLSAGLPSPRRKVVVQHPLALEQVPLVGTQVAPLGTCPTATRAGARYGRDLAGLVEPARTPRGERQMPGGWEIVASVRDGLRWSVTNDLSTRLAGRARRAYYDPLSTHPTQEESIRRSANSALAAAVLLTTTRRDRPPGVSRAELLDYARWHIRSLACQHGATTPGGWGNAWQSALWAVTVGQAAWMLWPELTDEERGYVAAMVVSEAEYAAARGPRYFRTRLGQELTPGDSQADEVSWDLMAPALATAMMPDHPHAGRWTDELIAMAIAAFARPGDLHPAVSVNGVRIDIRLPGTNANEDGTVTNHGIVNPDYTQNVQHLWWAASLLRAGGQPVPEALFLNADVVYRGLSTVQFPSPPYAAPGGTVYQPLGQIYYPMGAGWGVRRPATFVGVDAFAYAYAAPDTRAAEFLAAHAADARALQLRWDDGRMYADGATEESYRLGREEYALQQMALAWWAGAVKDGLRMTVDSSMHPDVSLGVGEDLP